MFPPAEAPESAFAGAVNEPDNGGAGVSAPAGPPQIPMQAPMQAPVQVPYGQPGYPAQDPRLAALNGPPPQSPLAQVMSRLGPLLAALASHGQGLGSFAQGYQGAQHAQAVNDDIQAQATQRRALMIHQMMQEQAQQQAILAREHQIAAAQAKNAELDAAKKQEAARKAGALAAGQAWKAFHDAGGIDEYNKQVDTVGKDGARQWLQQMSLAGLKQRWDNTPVPSLQELFDANAYIDPNTGHALGGKPVEKPNPEMAAFFKDRKTTPDKATKKDWYDYNQFQAESKKAKDPEDLPLSPQAISMFAKQLAQTGQMSYSGYGKAAVADRRRIANEAAQLYPSLDLASQKAAYTGNASALSRLTQQQSMIRSFANTAEKNFGMVLENGQKIVDTGSAWANQPIRAVSEKLLGDSDITAYRAALGTVAPEFARILTTANLQGQLTDSARQEVMSYLGPDATFQSIVKAGNVLRRENQNRLQAIADEIAMRKQLISALPGEAKPQPGVDFDYSYDPTTRGLVPGTGPR